MTIECPCKFPGNLQPTTVSFLTRRGALGRGWLMCCGLLALPGCQSRIHSDTVCDVTGTVTLDGKPLERGQVLFSDLGPEPRQHVADVAQGHYAAHTTPGEKRVSIRSYRDNPNQLFNGLPIQEQILPARYNDDTTLSVTLQPGSNPPADFHLTSTP